MIDEIIEAASVKGRDGIYCIGSFAKIVSFSAQQYRALNLVWALHEGKKILPGQAVAVIGSGMTGVTAAAAFLSYGYKVDLFEARKELLPKQLNTEHRMVHPTINRWPAIRPSLTTTFPFLEWYAGTCSKITRNLSDQFEKLIHGTGCRVLKEVKVIDISDPATKLYQLRTDKKIPDPQPYGLILIAMGFGDEREVPDFNTVPYWRPDDLEEKRISEAVEHFIVNGCGDGGLIDTLRIVHREFDKGLLAFETAVDLFDTPIANAILTAEKLAAASKDNSILDEAYVRAAETLRFEDRYASTQGDLQESLKSFGGMVYLSDTMLTVPFSLNAAPIHKLMVEHARQEGKVKFRHGAPTKLPDAVKLVGNKFPSEPTTHVVIRNGALEPDFGLLLSEDEVEDLKAKQGNLDDRFITAAWPGAYKVPPGFVSHDLSTTPTADFIDSRLLLANRAVQIIAEDAKVAPAAHGFRVTYRGKVPRLAPDSLFGIPADSAEVPVARGL